MNRQKLLQLKKFQHPVGLSFLLTFVGLALASGAFANAPKAVSELVPQINLPSDNLRERFNESKLNNNAAILKKNRRELEAPPSLFPLASRSERVRLSPSPNILRERLQTLTSNPSLGESIVLRLNTLDPAAIIEQLAKSSISEKLFSREANRIKNEFRRVVLSRAKESRLELQTRDHKWLDLGKLSSTLAQGSISPSFSGSELFQAWKDPATRAVVEEHFQQAGRSVLTSLLDSGPKGLLGRRVNWEEFLPAHLQRQVGKFSPYRGRNCFATALNFHDARAERMGNINRVREEGHHPALINNDEFMEALWLGYRELGPVDVLEGLQFGDVVVFYDPAEGEDSYSSLKHAMVHMAGDIYFQKPSKSASSPIEFSTWSEVAEVWVRLIPNVDYRVFRRVPNGRLDGRNPKTAIEKIPWTN